MENQKKEATKRRARNFLIAPAFQKAVIFYSILLSLPLLSIQYLSMRYFFNRYTLDGNSIGLQADHPFFKFIKEQEAFMNSVFLFTALLLVIVNALFGLVISHRIAGPIHHLKKYFRQFRSGESKALSFRKRDFFPELPKIINEALNPNPKKDQQKLDLENL